MFSWRGKKIDNLDGEKVKKNFVPYTILGLAVGAMTFFGVCDSPGNKIIAPTGVAASVGGENITAIEFRRAHIRRTQQAQQQYKDNFDPVQLGIAAQTVNSLVEQEIYYQEALKNGIAASEDEVANIIIDGKYFQGEDGKFDPRMFQRYLRGQAHNEASFSEELRRDIVNTKLRNFMTTTYRSSKASEKIDKMLSDTKLNVSFVAVDPLKINVPISEEDVAKFLAEEKNKNQVESRYNQNKSQYNQEESVKARHVLIAFEGATRASGEGAKRSKEDAKALADKVLAEAKAKPTEFAEIVKKYTDEPSGKVKGGDLGFIKKGEMVEPFTNAAFALDKGAISDVVETKFGYHIIKVDDRKAAVNRSLESVEKEIARNMLQQQKRPELAKARADELKAKVAAGEEIKPLLDQYGMSWQDSGEFALDARFLPGGLGTSEDLKTAAVSLKEPGAMSEVIEADGKFYLLKLKERKEADLSNLAEKDDDDIANPFGNASALEAFFAYNKLMSDIKKEYEEENKIFRNDDFLQYDARLQSGQGGS